MSRRSTLPDHLPGQRNKSRPGTKKADILNFIGAVKRIDEQFGQKIVSFDELAKLAKEIQVSQQPFDHFLELLNANGLLLKLPDRHYRLNPNGGAN